jgi:hypothetical protein
MELTEGILKSIESSFYSNYSGVSYMVKYKGMIMKNDGVKLFKTKGAAKFFVTKFIKNIFYHGEYWHKYAQNIFRNTGYLPDYSGTIELLPRIGSTNEFERNLNSISKKIVDSLINEKIITIEEV